ncbi:hypothetical protein ACFRAO_08865 [Streptomyces sp. NPDC056656]|uniref:hypothetical protein n=1 Tax=Streptomyces sp. NPDC056656 TaxID=3345895 RepID=UPI003680B1D7
MSNTAYGPSVEALRQDVAPSASPEFATLDQDGAAPRLGFHQVPEPKSVKNRLNLDLISPSSRPSPSG